jgi:hypothetical protein
MTLARAVERRESNESVNTSFGLKVAVGERAVNEHCGGFHPCDGVGTGVDGLD